MAGAYCKVRIAVVKENQSYKSIGTFSVQGMAKEFENVMFKYNNVWETELKLVELFMAWRKQVERIFVSLCHNGTPIKMAGH